jgi:23S rRNA (cytidine1920-2'-O)/16S rRNA (cytidine1409-2'-O)-methyltransferase
MTQLRLDLAMVKRGLVPTRSQAESYIRLGEVRVNNLIATKPGFLVLESDDIKLTAKEQYVSRAALKLASVAEALKINFKDKVVLDVGSSTGGFTDFALRHGAKKVIAVDVGSNQMHPSLRENARIDLHEKTDIRDFKTSQKIDLVLADVSFISLREILPHISQLMSHNTELVTMVKPQFEVGESYKHKGVIKNDKIRRNTLKNFEKWVQNLYRIIDKADSKVAGAKGNLERFYLLQKP